MHTFTTYTFDVTYLFLHFDVPKLMHTQSKLTLLSYETKNDETFGEKNRVQIRLLVKLAHGVNAIQLENVKNSGRSEIV